MRPALDVPDAVALELGLELGITPPAGVLPALVGQDLARHAVLGDPARERLQHQRAALMMGERQTHQIARVIIEERRHVQPLVLPEQEREQVRLPQLVRLSALEAMRTWLRLGPRLRPGSGQAFLLQHPPYRGGRCAQSKVALQHIPDPATAGRRLRTLRRHDRRTPRRHRTTAWRPYPATAARPQARLAVRAIAPHPLHHRRVRHPEPRRHRVRTGAAIHHRSDHRQHQVRRPALANTPHCTVSTARPLRRSLLRHSPSPQLPAHQANWRASARTLICHSIVHQVVRSAHDMARERTHVQMAGRRRLWPWPPYRAMR